MFFLTTGTLLIIHIFCSSSSGSRYRPTWRPRRETLNIDSIFTRQRDSQLGYGAAPGPSLSAEPQQPLPFVGAATQPGLEDGERRETGEVGFGLVGQPRSSSGGRTMGPPAPPPLRGVEHQPRLIQRMESGYESSERNSSSPDRYNTHKYQLLSLALSCCCPSCFPLVDSLASFLSNCNLSA